jgi:hypothetical protein
MSRHAVLTDATTPLQSPACATSGAVRCGVSDAQWDVTKSFYLDVEALYMQQDTASSVTGLVPTPVGLRAPTFCSLGDCANKNA